MTSMGHKGKQAQAKEKEAATLLLICTMSAHAACSSHLLIALSREKKGRTALASNQTCEQKLNARHQAAAGARLLGFLSELKLVCRLCR